MAETLYLRLDSPVSGEVTWSTGIGPEDTGLLSDVSSVAVGKHVVVFVPSKEVLFLEAIFPTRKRDKILQAAPYIVEEQLAEDVEELHFALGKMPPRGTGVSADSISFVVVSRKLMNTWLENLRAVCITPHALVPDLLALPFVADSWTLLNEPTGSLLRTGLQSGLALDLDWLPMVLGQAGTPPLSIRVVDCALGASIPLLATPTEEVPCQNGAMALLVEGYRSSDVIDLLQGSYSKQEQLGRLWKPWRTAAAVLLAWIGLQVIGLVLEKNRLSEEDIALRGQMTDIYLRSFPDAKRVVSPRAQMEQRLNALRTQPDDTTTGLIGLLTKAAPVLGSTSGSEVRTLRYKDSGIEVDLSLKNLQMLDQLKQRLTETGLEVEIQSARAQGDSVEGHLQIRGKST
ncbi:Type II secretion system protein L [Gammaproteobacteria bacterium]